MPSQQQALRRQPDSGAALARPHGHSPQPGNHCYSPSWLEQHGLQPRKYSSRTRASMASSIQAQAWATTGEHRDSAAAAPGGLAESRAPKSRLQINPTFLYLLGS